MNLSLEVPPIQLLYDFLYYCFFFNPFPIPCGPTESFWRAGDQMHASTSGGISRLDAFFLWLSRTTQPGNYFVGPFINKANWLPGTGHSVTPSIQMVLFFLSHEPYLWDFVIFSSSYMLRFITFSQSPLFFFRFVYPLHGIASDSFAFNPILFTTSSYKHLANFLHLQA